MDFGKPIVDPNQFRQSEMRSSATHIVHLAGFSIAYSKVAVPSPPEGGGVVQLANRNAIMGESYPTL